jgi:hypothetical protein
MEMQYASEGLDLFIKRLGKSRQESLLGTHGKLPFGEARLFFQEPFILSLTGNCDGKC